jgi:hypothetical protein
MNPHFFFEGTLREEAASAFLATLLEQDPGFRAAFLRRVGVDFSVDVAPRIRVEPYLGGGKWPDVLVQLPGSIVVVENKVRPRIVQPDQLARYYLAAVQKWPRRRVIAVLLMANVRVRAPEVRLVRREIRRGARDDRAIALTWSQVRWLLRFADGPDAEFRRTGIAAITQAISVTGLAQDLRRPFLSPHGHRIRGA